MGNSTLRAAGGSPPEVMHPSEPAGNGGRSSNSQREAALGHARDGLRVFPLKPRDKTPAITGWQDAATTDEAQIRAWWGQNPDYNVGIFCGDGLAVLDVDGQTGRASLEALAEEHGASNTKIVRTGGGGFHFMFKDDPADPLPQSAGRIAPGLDIRAGGKGYIVGAGSIHPNGNPYVPHNGAMMGPVWPWLKELAGSSSSNGMPANRAVSERITEGGRNHALASLAGYLVDKGLDPDAALAALLIENSKRCSPPLEDREVEQIARSIARYEPTRPYTDDKRPEDEFEAVPEEASSDNPDAGRDPRIVALEKLNEKYGVVQEGSSVRIMEERPAGAIVLLRKSDFELKLQHKRVPHEADARKEEPLARAWLNWEGRRQFEEVVFAPGETDLPPSQFNQWRGWGVKPREEGSCDLFLTHLREIVCRGDEELFMWFMDWLAHMVQQPMEKPGSAIGLYSRRQGTGKTIVARILGQIIGGHHIVVDNVRQVTGNFNAHLDACLFVVAEEASWKGSPAAAGTLKNIITGHTLAIERKGVDLVQRPSYIRLLATSNDPHIFPVSPEDRRLAVFEVAEDRAEDFEYFGALMDQMDSGGYEKLLHTLLNWPLDMNRLRRPPRTEALEKQVAHSMPPEEAWLVDLLESGEMRWGTVLADGHVRVTITELHSSYASTVPKNQVMNKKAFGFHVQDHLGAKKTEKRVVVLGGIKSNEYLVPPLPGCRDRYSQRGRAARQVRDDPDAAWVVANEFGLPGEVVK